MYGIIRMNEHPLPAARPMDDRRQVGRRDPKRLKEVRLTPDDLNEEARERPEDRHGESGLGAMGEQSAR